MNKQTPNQTTWQGILRRKRLPLIALVGVAVVAFFLGGLLLGGGSSENSAGEEKHTHATAAEAANEPEMWTCSMHPQIQLPEPGKCPICFMDLIPVETGGGEELDPNQIRMSETAVQLAKIQTTPAVRGYAEREIRMVGKLDYAESEVAYITAWVPGRLERLFVDYTGATVSAGDHMVHLYSPELIATQEELIQAIKALETFKESGSLVLTRTANETLESAREKLRLYGLSAEQIAGIERRRKTENYLTIKAPIGGVVIHKDALEGMYVETGTRIYTIADLSTLWVFFDAYESDLPWIQYGQRVKFTSPSFPGEQFEAKINFIDPVVDPQTRTIDVRAVVANKDGWLKPGMFVRGVVHSRLDADGNVVAEDQPVTEDAPLLIPASAPLITGKRAVVYVEVPDEDGTVFEGREVLLGPRAGEAYVVKEGIEEGELVVTNGAFKIDSELQIRAKPSMMSPEEMDVIAGHDHEEGGAGDDQAAGPVHQAGEAERIAVSEAARRALEPVYDAYFKVQMALANDDPERAEKAFTELGQATNAVEMALFEGQAHNRWMGISAHVQDAAEDGAAAGDIVESRDAFFYLSLAMIELHDTFGHATDIPYYLTFCPMARDNAGAYWLQTEDIVWNSFYGDMMLRCGEIKQELPADGIATK